MDKKEAEMEASRKSKETQHAAGKNSGMSGRDLVCDKMMCGHPLLTQENSSSNTTQNGSKTTKKKKTKAGIYQYTVVRKASQTM
jgi:hypothetical protein